MSLHLGILQTDSVLPQFQAEHGDYPQMFRRLFDAVDGEPEGEIRYTDYDVQQGPPPAMSCDAYLITGSKCSVYDDLPWIGALADFLRAARAAGRKIIGVCFGHQLVAHYFGGRVGAAAAGWAVGVHNSRVLRKEPWMAGAGYRTELALLSSHQDQVLELPHGAEVYLSSDFCPLAGYTLGDEVITVQGHPEFDKGYARALLDMRREILGEGVYQRAVASFEQPTAERLMAAWLLDFIRGGRG